ncbi:hypothetical protein [uncultured Mediterranean phage uvMED]|jgi:hypothetical protein|nr:hypothetical protein [uncultured Mediterranean phage uvMED]BAQ93574.1 hypothetical protein [uncultured Mediterranean phage uvMED]BAR25022.1 hypothetical protein [uncultured Mediterranean phage uvMED]
MPEIPEIGIGAVQVREIPTWRSIPPQSIPVQPPVTLQLGLPIIDMPGCVETRNTQPGNEKAYDTDPKGNLVVCDGTMPSYKPLDFTPGTLTYGSAKPPTQIEQPPKKSAGKQNQPKGSSSLSSGKPDISNLPIELPCPPPDAIPIGAKNKSQTAIIVGYERINGICEAQYEKLDVPAIVSNYLPGAPVVMTTAAIAATATTSAIVAKPLGDLVLKVVKPLVKKTIKKIKAKLGKKIVPESVAERRKFQRALRK